MQFCSRVFDVELPVDAFLFGVALTCPRGDFLAQFLNRAESTAFDALNRQRTQLVFGTCQFRFSAKTILQPTAVFGRRDDFQSSRQRSRHVRFKRFMQRTFRMPPQKNNTEVVANQDHIFGIGKIFLQENFHLMRPIIFRFLFTDTHVLPTAKRVREHENIHHVCPFLEIKKFLCHPTNLSA